MYKPSHRFFVPIGDIHLLVLVIVIVKLTLQFSQGGTYASNWAIQIFLGCVRQNDSLLSLQT